MRRASSFYVFSLTVLFLLHFVSSVEGVSLKFDTANFSISYIVEAGSPDEVKSPDLDTEVSVKLSSGTEIGRTKPGNGKPSYNTGNAPNYVETIGIWLEYCLSEYDKYDFKRPWSIGKIDISIENIPELGLAFPFPLNLPETITLDNSIRESQIGITVAHELFHAIQFAYDNPLLPIDQFVHCFWVYEGTAIWMEDFIDNGNNDYRRWINRYLQLPNQTLTKLSAGEKSYQAVSFWKYLTEQLTEYKTDDRAFGIDVIKAFWEAESESMDFDPIVSIDTVLAKFGAHMSFRDLFKNWVTANYLKDLVHADPTDKSDKFRKYDYLEDQLYTELNPTDTIIINDESTRSYSAELVEDYAANYYVLEIGDNVKELDVEVSAKLFFGQPFYRILAIGDGTPPVVSFFESEFKEQKFTIPSTNLSQVVIIVGAYEDGGEYELRVSSRIGPDNDQPQDSAQVPELSVSKETLDFDVTEAELTFDIRNSGSGTLEWKISEDKPWLGAKSNFGDTSGDGSFNGIGDATITVMVGRIGLSEGIHEADLHITSNGGDRIIHILMTVELAKLSTTSEILDFGTTDTQLTFDISNSSSGVITWEISEDESWLSVSSSFGDTSDDGSFEGTGDVTITATVERAGFPERAYESELLITSNGGSMVIPVLMSVVLSEVITLPDPKLEAAIREELGITTGPITDVDLAKLVELSVLYAKYLTGIEHCINLKRLAHVGK